LPEDPKELAEIVDLTDSNKIINEVVAELELFR